MKQMMSGTMYKQGTIAKIAQLKRAKITEVLEKLKKFFTG